MVANTKPQQKKKVESGRLNKFLMILDFMES